MKRTGKRVGLALGGGGIRGLSHIGVLKVLEQEGIDIDLIVGTSAGALIGGAYAGGQSPREIQTRLEAYLRSPEFDATALKSIGLAVSPEQQGRLRKAESLFMKRYYMIRSFFRPSLLPAGEFHSLINFFLPEMDIRQTRIPFRAVTTDLITGRQVVLSEGNLRTAVLASCAVPGAVEPVPSGERLLADGGITSLVPVHATREAGADIVIAVTVDRDLTSTGNMETAQEIFYRAGEITASRLGAVELEDADVIIRPEVGDLHWMDFRRSGDLIRVGEEATRRALEEIYTVLPLQRRLSRLAGPFLAMGKRLKRSFLRAAAVLAGTPKEQSPPLPIRDHAAAVPPRTETSAKP
ncbi:MAG TPA: patatin-like phospholipase family protein [Syntrophales bacterium]|nr:patatin-like phospholipase family protein [Syntrophales bacterium]HON23275.1 patatin-like phospholipase family protein [Syntrophales bacterium]HOU78665.1 patatin-like phospholipase family protein [Syntrophales bacterium]HPC33319.1 patatin-like phospholipase family protein [Syntrophales bacterium]HQG34870.1 patatin-like phospholipase family protein [Syntrophales bacterium]